MLEYKIKLAFNQQLIMRRISFYSTDFLSSVLLRQFIVIVKKDEAFNFKMWH